MHNNFIVLGGYKMLGLFVMNAHSAKPDSLSVVIVVRKYPLTSFKLSCTFFLLVVI